MKTQNYVWIFGIILLIGITSMSTVMAAPVTDTSGIMTLSGPVLQEFGMRFVPKYNVTLLSFNSTNTSNCQVGKLRDNSHNLLASVNVNGTNQFNILYNLTAGQTYYVSCNNTATSYTGYYDNCAFPIGRTNVNFTGSYDSSAGDDTTYCREIVSVTTQNTSELYPPAGPAISFQGQTPVNNTIQYYTNNSIVMNTTASGMGGAVNTTQRIYYENGTLFTSYVNASFNVTHTFTGLPIGRLYINATLNNATNSTTTDTRLLTIYNITVGSITNPSTNQNITQYLNVNWTNSTTTNNSVAINNFRVFLMNADTTLNQTLAYTSSLNFSSYDVYLNNLSIGNYYIGIEVNDSKGNKVNYTRILFNHPTNAQLNITAINYTGGSVQNFAVNITELNTSRTISQSTTNNLTQIDIIRGYAYYILLTVAGQANTAITYNATGNPYQAYQFTVYPANSINVSIYNESSGVVINQSVTLTITDTQTLQQYVYTTSTGNYLITNIGVGNYTLAVASPTPIYYSPRYYIVNTNSDTQKLNAYLAASNNTLLFNVKTTAGVPLSGILVTQSTNVNGTVVILQSSYSDISGKAQFVYIPYTFYQFSASGTGYTTTTFDLNPVLFTSYDIVMNTLGQGIVVPTAYVSYSPGTFYNRQGDKFNFTITSTYNGLTNYSYTVTGPNVSISNSGTNSNGQTFSNNFRIANATQGSTLTIFYQYTLMNGVYYNQTITYPISIPLYNQTLTSIGQGQTFGFEVGDRVLIVTIIDIICFGVGLAVFGAMGGLFLAVANTTIFSLSGFIPIWIFYSTLVIALLYMIGRGVDNG